MDAIPLGLITVDTISQGSFATLGYPIYPLRGIYEAIAPRTLLPSGNLDRVGGISQ